METPAYLEKNRSRKPKIKRGQLDIMRKGHVHKAKSDYKRKPKHRNNDYE